MFNQSQLENSNGHERVMRMAVALSEEASAKGLTSSNPIVLTVLGSARPDGNEVASRTFIVSFTQPAASHTEVELWVNPAERTIYRSNPVDASWHEVFSRTELFSR